MLLIVRRWAWEVGGQRLEVGVGGGGGRWKVGGWEVGCGGEMERGEKGGSSSTHLQQERKGCKLNSKTI